VVSPYLPTSCPTLRLPVPWLSFVTALPGLNEGNHIRRIWLSVEMQKRTRISPSRADSCSSDTSSKPNRLANRTQRMTRKGSSKNVCFGGRGVRMIPFFKSSRPWGRHSINVSARGERRLHYCNGLRRTVYAHCRIASLLWCRDVKHLAAGCQTSRIVSNTRKSNHWDG